MSKSVAYYSHTYYDVNGSLDVINAIFDMPTRQASSGSNTFKSKLVHAHN